MKMLHLVQGTDEWLQARVGLCTASKFKDACDQKKNGEWSAKAIAYAAELAVEKIAGVSMDDTYVNYAMRRGTELEPLARMEYESYTGNFATEAGIAISDDGLYGYSTDGLVDDAGLIEIKCPLSSEKVIAIWRNGSIEDYEHQIQGGMWITGREWCDFVMYAPQLTNVKKELFYRRIWRDDEFIKRMTKTLDSFMGAVNANLEVLQLEPA